MTTGLRSGPRKGGLTHGGRDPVIWAFGAFSSAEQATWTALLVLAYQSGGVGVAGWASAAVLLPAAVGAPFVGHWIPRLTRRPLAAGYAVQASTMAVCAAAVAAECSIVVVTIVAAIATLALTSTRPAHQSAIARRPSPAERLGATTATGAVDGAARLIGPLGAAGLLAVSGPTAVFTIGAALLGLSAWLTRDVASPAELGPRALLSFRATNVAIARTRGVIAVLVTLTMATVVLGVIETISTEIAVVRLDGGDATTGALLAAFGCGLGIGGLVAAGLLARAMPTRVLVTGGALTAVGLLASCASGGVVLPFAAFVMAGAGLQILQVAGWVVLHANVPVASTAGVFALLESNQLIGNVVGAAVAGATVTWAGVTPVAAWSGALLVAVAAAAARRVHAQTRNQATWPVRDGGPAPRALAVPPPSPPAEHLLTGPRHVAGL